MHVLERDSFICHLGKNAHRIATYRAAAFDVTGRKTSATLSAIFRFAHKTARQEVVSSTVILETQAAWHLPSTNVSTFAVTSYHAD